jgi:His/Glu/Gln/Arg/opine family amino acid ABC transporter permease subunit
VHIDTSQFSLAHLLDRFFNLQVISDWAGELPAALARTLELSILGGLIGLCLGLLLAWGTISRSRFLRSASWAYVETFRGTSLLVQLLILYFAAPLVGIRFDPFPAGIVALGLNSAAYVAEIFRAGIESVERGQVEAARSLGMSYNRTLASIVLPQAIRRVIPPMTNEAVALIKDSALVSVIGVTEVLRVAQQATGATFNASLYTVAAALYLSLTIPLGLLARRLERRLGQRGTESWLTAERHRWRTARARVAHEQTVAAP